MALTSALFTGLSGLNVNQTKLSVVGNNIANANTVAFKSSRALFKPQFYVTDGGGSPPSGEFGGTNPNQRGLGSQIGAIEKNFNAGPIEPTGKPTDIAIDGDGFFVVQGDSQKFTRDGSFGLNSANQLTTTGGEFVQGYGVDSDFNVIPGELQNITIPLGSLTSAKATENAFLKGNLNANGPVASGASILTTQELTVLGGGTAPAASDLLTNLADAATPATPAFTDGQVFTLAGKKGGRDVEPATFTVTASSTVQELMDFFNQGMGIFAEGTAPDQVPDDGDATTPAPGVTLASSPGDTANTARIMVTGNLGKDNSLAIPGSAFATQTGSTPLAFDDGVNAAGIESDPVGESVHTSFVAYDSLGTPLSVGLTAVFESKSDTGNVWRFYAESADDTDAALPLATGTLTFDSEGKLIDSTGDTIDLDRANTGALTPLSVKLDFSAMTSLTSTSSELVMTRQDGNEIGTLDDFSIGADGTITGSFTNGQTRTLGQMAIATFTNPGGLIDDGGNMYAAGTNSGEPVIAAPLTLGAGSVRAGALEQSNVDLSEEFINLIIASTGFSASSRVITTSDQLITELLNSSR
ncbi:MAG: flagellar hook protein FlgE [Phycisphaerae bacterium]|nr:flagellar hook-basal body complex protein [Tepidisphaeraceae bacterium]